MSCRSWCNERGCVISLARKKKQADAFHRKVLSIRLFCYIIKSPKSFFSSCLFSPPWEAFLSVLPLKRQRKKATPSAWFKHLAQPFSRALSVNALLCGTQAARAKIDGLARSIYHSLNAADIGLPGSIALTVGVGYGVTERYTLAADTANCHCEYLLLFCGLTRDEFVL